MEFFANFLPSLYMYIYIYIQTLDTDLLLFYKQYHKSLLKPTYLIPILSYHKHRQKSIPHRSLHAPRTNV